MSNVVLYILPTIVSRIIVKPKVHFVPRTLLPTTEAAQFSREIKKWSSSRAHPDKVPESYPQFNANSYTEVTHEQDFFINRISVTLSNFISHLNTHISPVITLFSLVLNSIIT
jgi:hypothetical protein